MKELLLGLCTIERPTQNYLRETLASIVEYISDEELGRGGVLVVDCNQEPVKYIEEIKKEFEEFIKKEFIIFKQPNFNKYPDISNLVNDSSDLYERFSWRTKQCLDYSEAFRLAYELDSPVYCHIEDDITVNENVIDRILYEISRKRNTVLNLLEPYHPWITHRFHPTGFIGRTFQRKDLLQISLFLRLFCNEMPADWLVDEYCAIRMAMNDHREHPLIGPTHLISLFKHIGEQSSLTGWITDKNGHKQKI